MKKKNMARVGVYMPETLREELLKLAEKEYRPLSTMVIVLIEEALENRAKK